MATCHGVSPGTLGSPLAIKGETVCGEPHAIEKNKSEDSLQYVYLYEKSKRKDRKKKKKNTGIGVEVDFGGVKLRFNDKSGCTTLSATHSKLELDL